MKIKLIAFEDGIVNIGFRRISSLVKASYPSTTAYIYNVSGSSALLRNIFLRQKSDDPKNKENIFINPEFIKEIIDADVVAFSGLTKFAGHIKKTISLVRRANNRAFIVWGGVHATICPEDAVLYADAVCVGEGEKSFLLLLRKIEAKEDVGNCHGFWVRTSGAIKKNALLPLMDNNELSLMPFQDYGFDIRYVTDNSLGPMLKEIYIAQSGLKYSTLWVLGCPFKCSYCSNGNFIRNHRDYAKLRHPPAEYLINEIANVFKKHDYINYIDLEDDNFLMLGREDISRFACLYKEKIRIPFFIPGLHPSTVNAEKLDILVETGLKKVRMGIQSGSKKTLSFYNRNTGIDLILQSASILSSFTPRIIPPFYDIMLDNPVETEEDKLQTLKLLRELKRPYLLYLYSLRVIPGTELYEFSLKNRQFHFQSAERTYQSIHDKQMGLMVYLLTLFKIPNFVFSFFLKVSKIPYINNLFFNIFRFLFLVKWFYYEVRSGNYLPLSVILPGPVIVSYKLRRLVKHLRSKILFKKIISSKDTSFPGD